MKLFLFVFLCSACFVHSSSQGGLTLVHEELATITKRITFGVLRILAGGLESHHDAQGVGFRLPVLPNFTDPLILDDVNLTFANTLLSGRFASRAAVIEGLSTLKDDLTVLPILPVGSFRAKYGLDVADVSLTGNYESDLDILTGTTLFTGSGDYSINLSGGSIQVDIVIRTYNLATRVEISSMDVNVGYQNFHIEAQDALFNGVVPNWAEINEELNRIFDIYWPVLNAKLVAPLKTIINHYIKTCTILELTGGKLDCLNDEPLPQITSAPEIAPSSTEVTLETSEDTSTTTGATIATPETTVASTPELSSTPNSATVPILSVILLSVVLILGLDSSI